MGSGKLTKFVIQIAVNYTLELLHVYNSSVNELAQDLQLA